MSLTSRTRHAARDQGVLRLVFEGPLRTASAPDIAIDALAVLRASGFDASLSFIATDEDDAFMRNDLHARAHALRVDEHVRFDARTGDVEGADAAIVLHRWAGEPLEPAFRAMRAGIPVVAFPQGGARDLLRDRALAACAKSCSGNDVASAIRALARDELGKRRLVVNARAFVTQTGKAPNA